MVSLRSVTTLWGLALDCLGYKAQHQQQSWNKLEAWLNQGAPKIAESLRQKHQLGPQQSLTLDVLVDGYLDWLQVDDRVADALDFANGPQTSGFAQMYQDALHAADNAGALARLKGYVGEQVAAANLAEQGFVVSFPELPNQPGYDLLVDGHPVQVKTTLVESGIRTALERYPDIPVLAPIELANSSLAGSEQLMFSPQFSHKAVQDLTEDSLSALRDMGHLSIPFLSLGFIGYRVGRKVQAGQALKVAAVDGLGDAAGLVLGGKAGMVLGGALGGLVAGSLGSAAVSWAAAAGAASVVASVGGKLGVVLGGSTLLALGPLGPVLALGALGALLGSMLGRSWLSSLIAAWRFRDLFEQLLPLCEAAGKYQAELTQALNNKSQAYQQKIDRVRQRIRANRQAGMSRFGWLLLERMHQRQALLNSQVLQFPSIKTAGELRQLSTLQSVTYAKQLVSELSAWKPEVALYPSASFKRAAAELAASADQLTSYLKSRC